MTIGPPNDSLRRRCANLQRLKSIMLTRLLLPIYKKFTLFRLRPLRVPHIDRYKLLGQLLIGVIFVYNVTLAAQAQASSQSPFLDGSQTSATSYISQSGYLDNRVMNLELQQSLPVHWVTETHRLSRGFIPGHSGLDIDGNTGDPIYAFQHGEVTLVSSSGPLGNHIAIQHKNGLQTVYAHLDTMSVQPGDQVVGGQTIGTMGSTGRSTGSHLHFETYLNGHIFDPATLF